MKFKKCYAIQLAPFICFYFLLKDLIKAQDFLIELDKKERVTQYKVLYEIKSYIYI